MGSPGSWPLFYRVAQEGQLDPPISSCLASLGIVLSEAPDLSQVLLWLCTRLGICISFDKSSLLLGVNIQTHPLKASQRAQDSLVWISWTPDNLVDLQWWMLQSDLFASRDIWDVSPDFLLYMDASTRDWAAPSFITL